MRAGPPQPELPWLDDDAGIVGVHGVSVDPPGSATVIVEVVRVDPETGARETLGTIGPTVVGPSLYGSNFHVPGGSPFWVEGIIEFVATATRGEQIAQATYSVVVDLTLPEVSYRVPESLTVGSKIRLEPSTEHDDIASYRTGGRLPEGLKLDSSRGVIYGAPPAEARARSVVIEVTDRAGNVFETELAFPAVKLGQVLSGFALIPPTIRLEDLPPVITAPSGAVGPIAYRSETPSVCGVDPTTGALIVRSVGTCTVTALAAATERHNVGTAQAAVVVRPPASPPPFPPRACILTVRPSPPDAARAVTTIHDCGTTVMPVIPPANACYSPVGQLPEVAFPATPAHVSVTAHYRWQTKEYTLATMLPRSGKGPWLVLSACVAGEPRSVASPQCDSGAGKALESSVEALVRTDKSLLAGLTRGESVRIGDACGDDQPAP